MCKTNYTSEIGPEKDVNRLRSELPMLSSEGGFQAAVENTVLEPVPPSPREALQAKQRNKLQHIREERVVLAQPSVCRAHLHSLVLKTVVLPLAA